VAGHTDVEVVVRAPLETVWTVSNAHELWSAERHKLYFSRDDGRWISFQVTSPPDERGRSWTYNVDRSQYPEQHTVYSRRWGNPELVYSVAWWLYSEVPEGTKIRCVQDFEMAADASVDDREMERIVENTSRGALTRMAARVEAAAAGHEATQES
jgi:aromatase